MKRIVTLLSDFGLEDAYVAQVKGRILTEVPGTTIVDITHHVPEYGILQAAWILGTTWKYFPGNTLHMAVVDPGVGTKRAVIMGRKGTHTFVGPDNGIFSFLFPADEITEVTWRPTGQISNTFHGRDIFAPVVCELLKGRENLGRPLPDPVSLNTDSPMVVHVDHFGNLITNIDASFLEKGCELSIEGTNINRRARNFEEIPEGELALVAGSASTIEIVACKKSAEEILGARVGTLLALL